MLRFTTLLISMIFSWSLFAQHTVSQDVLVTVEKNKREQEINLVYNANNRTAGKMTIVLSLEGRSFERADGSIPAVKELLPGTNRVIQLTNVRGAPAYSYMWVAGCVDTEHKEVEYLLPLAPGKTTRVDSIKGISEVFLSQEPPTDIVAFSFKAAPGDQVFAARRGTVIEVENKQDRPEGEGLSFKRETNFVVIEHDDCTRGRYELFAKNGISVEYGTSVEAGDLLGVLMDGSAYGSGTHLRFSVYYTDLTRKQLIEKQKDRAKKYQRRYVPIDLHGVDGPGEATIIHPEELIFQEMRKKEIKKWKKVHGK